MNNEHSTYPIYTSVENIPSNVYMVYILICDGKAIVVGHGQFNRAKVVFDDINNITRGHIKALYVRLYKLFSPKSKFEPYIIECSDKTHAQKIEKYLHNKIGGNTREISESIMSHLLDEFEENSLESILLRMALYSSFDGISDLVKWKREGIIKDEVWKNICKRLQICNWQLKEHNVKKTTNLPEKIYYDSLLELLSSYKES
jgi:hypothetical protein